MLSERCEPSFARSGACASLRQSRMEELFSHSCSSQWCIFVMDMDPTIACMTLCVFSVLNSLEKTSDEIVIRDLLQSLRQELPERMVSVAQVLSMFQEMFGRKHCVMSDGRVLPVTTAIIEIGDWSQVVCPN